MSRPYDDGNSVIGPSKEAIHVVLVLAIHSLGNRIGELENFVTEIETGHGKIEPKSEGDKASTPGLKQVLQNSPSEIAAMEKRIADVVVRLREALY